LRVGREDRAEKKAPEDGQLEVETGGKTRSKARRRQPPSQPAGARAADAAGGSYRVDCRRRAGFESKASDMKGLLAP
jgi:hypothetical protein